MYYLQRAKMTDSENNNWRRRTQSKPAQFAGN